MYIPYLPTESREARPNLAVLATAILIESMIRLLSRRGGPTEIQLVEPAVSIQHRVRINKPASRALTGADALSSPKALVGEKSEGTP